MKIGYDAKRFFHNASGLGNYSRDLIRILSEEYPDNEYVLFAKNLSERGADILRRENVSFSPLSKGSFARQLNMGMDAQREDCDLFHGLSGLLPFRWDKKPIKKLLTVHDLIFLKYPQFYKFIDRKLYRWKSEKSVAQADRIIAISEQTKRDLIEYYKVQESKISIVYQTCHQAFKQTYSEDEKNKVREKYNLPAEFVLNVGTIELRKNVFSVVKALEDSDIPLVLVGKETSYAQEIRRFVEKNKMQKRVLFLKNVSMSELAMIYQLSTVFIYPSLYEGFGIPVIEALFCRTPVITSNTSSLPEAGGPHSLYVDPLNVADVKSKLLYFWENSSAREIAVEKSFEFVQKFSEDRIAKELIKIYDSL